MLSDDDGSIKALDSMGPTESYFLCLGEEHGVAVSLDNLPPVDETFSDTRFAVRDFVTLGTGEVSSETIVSAVIVLSSGYRNLTMDMQNRARNDIRTRPLMASGDVHLAGLKRCHLTDAFTIDLPFDVGDRGEVGRSFIHDQVPLASHVTADQS